MDLVVAAFKVIDTFWYNNSAGGTDDSGAVRAKVDATRLRKTMTNAVGATGDAGAIARTLKSLRHGLASTHNARALQLASQILLLIVIE